MNIVEQYTKNYRAKLKWCSNSPILSSTMFLSLSACGGKSGSSVSLDLGFPSSYRPPESNYDPPTIADPYAGLLSTPYVSPYWVLALEMDQHEAHIPVILDNYSKTLFYTFPSEQPDYNHFGVSGWQPATEDMKTATQQIMERFEEILDVSFIEGSEATNANVIVVARSQQTTTSGFSYFPNNYYEIGMDVFIANNYTSPNFITDFLTNYDYEVLVHELGHALGLKHPFEAHGANANILTSFEDNSSNTVMSYDHKIASFDGNLRPLDWMALTKFYGVKSTYNATDDTYFFSSSSGAFIIDGAGVDTISAVNTSIDVVIDCRPGAHSHLGQKSTYITAANQLTISHGSDIENVVTGSGNDIVTGTDLNNVISTGAGDDKILSGGGADVVNSGTGADQIDLSEAVQETDIVVFDAPSSSGLGLGLDTIYGFMQGEMGDIMDFSSLMTFSAELFPLVPINNAPIANFSSGVLRIVGENLTNASDVSYAFQEGEGSSLSISPGTSALIISASSQATGADQCIFQADNFDTELSFMQLAVLKGNMLDIDQWSVDNFNFVA